MSGDGPAAVESLDGAPGEAAPTGDDRLPGPPLWHASTALGLWMASLLAVAGLVVAGYAGLLFGAVGLAAALAAVGTGLLALALVVYDGVRARGTDADRGFRFDPLVTAVVLVLVLAPLAAPVYAIVRIQGAYFVATGVDPDGMDLGDEFDLMAGELFAPGEGGVPSPWPVTALAFAWLAVLFGDGALAVSLVGDGGLLFGAVAAVVMRAVATPFLLGDAYLMARTGDFGRGEAVAVAALTAVLLPVAAVGYVPYRLQRAYA